MIQVVIETVVDPNQNNEETSSGDTYETNMGQNERMKETGFSLIQQVLNCILEETE